jgi:hypothetical protein
VKRNGKFAEKVRWIVKTYGQYGTNCKLNSEMI